MAEKFRWAASPAEGSQIRSRDVFPQAAAAIALGLPTALGDEIDARAVPPPPSSVIAYVDGYGNLKTTIAYDAKKVGPGKRIRVRVNDREHEAAMSDGAFSVRHGELAFAPGSSGWPVRQAYRVPTTRNQTPPCEQTLPLSLMPPTSSPLFDSPVCRQKPSSHTFAPSK